MKEYKKCPACDTTFTFFDKCFWCEQKERIENGKSYYDMKSLNSEGTGPLLVKPKKPTDIIDNKEPINKPTR